MRNVIAKVRNVKSLLIAHERLLSGTGAEKMALLYGSAGLGKTVTAAWLITQTNGVYVRAAATWCPSLMLQDLVQELGLPETSRCYSMVKSIAERLRTSRQVLFIDEADYLLHNLKMLETLRDIHDLAGTPVFLIGMEGIDYKLLRRKQLSSRIVEIVKFQPSNLVDSRTLADTCCEVGIDDELLGKIHSEAKGNIRLMSIALGKVEKLARTQKWEAVSAQQWEKSGESFFLSLKGGR